ncbi:hypothetical protein [Caulobacter sp. NIBR1757]|uniref:hypothetical protein n=1 Tax=Caulobacter sp. NIBR1757 TaxID=3016000 RepID=UPI0022F099F1|nr:hypothetical protein [Caulobacter sp. NIBR1757]WGM38653.1 hypothetical protein AMEJIAPC_01557 [Caulobacter sp. NIBR1757]
MMKKILLTVAATAAIVAAMPAAAQSYQPNDRDGRGGYDQRRDYDRRGGGERYNPNEFGNRRWSDGSRREWAQARRIDARQAQLAQRIDTAARRRALSAGEARNFFFKLQNIEQLERGYKRHNRDLSRAEVQVLNYRLDLLQREIQYKIRT